MGQGGRRERHPAQATPRQGGLYRRIASCLASNTFLGPVFYGGVWSTWMIGTSANKNFMNEYIETTP
jgi:hypothetical protein